MRPNSSWNLVEPLLTWLSRGELEGAALLRVVLSISLRSSHREPSFLAGLHQVSKSPWNGLTRNGGAEL